MRIAMTKHPLWSRYRSMLARCYRTDATQYKDYGGRGIQVCDRWRFNFWLFVHDVGLPPTPQHTMDRYPNNNGDYEPSNFRWATRLEQSTNRQR